MSKEKANRCALYLRSSKDRHDVSIDAQRRELVALAGKHALTPAAEYADPVERADDWHRPGFAAMLHDIEHGAARDWETLLVLDAARLARDDEYLAAYFRHQCRKRGIRIIFSKFPPVNPLHDVMVQHVDQLISRVHSMISREKGLAGMAENVRQGYRAGGRAPYGYDLKPIETGATRDGAPVRKSRLEPNADLPAIGTYLKRRATGAAARQAARAAGVRLSMSSLVDVEWRAFTYAGHTVWNQLRVRGAGEGGYEGGVKRRPRADWVIQRDTHPAAITEAEAEAIVSHREKGRTVYTRGDTYLLSGILVDPAGRRWHGDQGFYRCGRRRLTAAKLERQVLAQIGRELTSNAIVEQVAALARSASKPGRRAAELAALQRQAAELERKLGRTRNLMLTLRHPEGLAPMLDLLTEEKQALEVQMAALVEELAGKRVTRMITEEDVRRALGGFVDGLGHMQRSEVKAALRRCLHQVVINPADLASTILYAIPAATGVSVASPRGFEPRLPP